LGSPAARLVADALDASADRHAQAGDPDGAPLHDPCALLCVTHPHLFSTEPAEVRISPDGTLDVAPSAAGDEGAVQVVRGADPARILDVVMTVCAP
jgi:inosine-uridine nucleoside N-ribohydrolase